MNVYGRVSAVLADSCDILRGPSQCSHWRSMLNGFMHEACNSEWTALLVMTITTKPYDDNDLQTTLIVEVRF